MKKLFLASSFDGVADLLPEFVGESVVGKKVVSIPTAILPVEGAESYGDMDRAAMKNLGLIVEELEVSTTDCETIERSISNADYIFVGGGNTFFLLQELKRKGADKLILRHIEQGKLYFGTSAGSLILQEKIIVDGANPTELAPDLNGNYSALSVIDFYLYVHYGQKYWGDDDERIAKYYSEIADLKLISDKQAVTVYGDRVEIVTAKT